LTGVLEAAEELLEVFAALDENRCSGGVDDQEVRGGVAEEEMFVGAATSSMYSGAMWDSSRLLRSST